LEFQNVQDPFSFFLLTFYLHTHLSSEAPARISSRVPDQHVRAHVEEVML